MIPNPLVVVRNSREVPSGRPVFVARMGERLLLWKDGPVIFYRRYRRAPLDAAGVPEKP
jgi:hypothetical protein